MKFIRGLNIFKPILFVLLLSASFLTCKKNCKPLEFSNYAQNGCGNFMVYDVQALPDTGFGFISINAKANELALGKNVSTFDLSQTSILTAKIESYTHAYVPYCTDVISIEQGLINSWTAISGTVEIKIAESKSTCDEKFVVDVVLKNAVFEDANGNQINVSQKSFLNVLVGWYSG